MGEIIDFEKLKKNKSNDSKKKIDDNFLNALDRLSKQNGIDYRKLILGNFEERKEEQDKLDKKNKELNE